MKFFGITLILLSKKENCYVQWFYVLNLNINITNYIFLSEIIKLLLQLGIIFIQLYVYFNKISPDLNGWRCKIDGVKTLI